MKPATDSQIATAIEVLRAYDGEMEPENQRDVDAVIEWLENFLDQRTLRKAARAHGVPVSLLRERLKAA